MAAEARCATCTGIELARGTDLADWADNSPNLSKA